jgi:F0F1-type ATP synthase assembly protein I
LILKRIFVNFVFAKRFNSFMNESENNSEKNKSSLKNFLTKPLIRTDSKTIQYSGMGITLVVTILIFFFIGRWLDGKFETTVVFTLILTFIGFAAGFYSFYLTIKKLTEDDKKENPKYNKY